MRFICVIRSYGFNGFVNFGIEETAINVISHLIFLIPSTFPTPSQGILSSFYSLISVSICHSISFSSTSFLF